MFCFEINIDQSKRNLVYSVNMTENVNLKHCSLINRILSHDLYLIPTSHLCDGLLVQAGYYVVQLGLFPQSFHHGLCLHYFLGQYDYMT